MKQESIQLQRHRYWQGQLLRSQDMSDQMADEAQLRAWHNRALHNTFGIARGLEVIAKEAGFLLQPGLAYDCFGRELIQAAEALLPAPLAAIPAAGLTLLAAYPEGGSDDMTAVCRPERMVSAAAPLRFQWRPGDDVSMRDGVPLARLLPDGTLDADFFRPRARALARPFMAGGMTIPGHTPWQIWQIRFAPVLPFIYAGFEVTVDTSAAGFADVPCYFAWLQETKADLFVASTQYIHEPTAERFTFRMWTSLLEGSIRYAVVFWNFVTAVLQQEVPICWLGIQPSKKQE